MTDNVLTKESQYVKPYYIESLGEEGLSSSDLAKALSVPIKRVHQKMQRQFLSEATNFPSWKVVTNVTSINNGTYANCRGVSYFFNVRAAKAFVATYANGTGRGYLDFLFSCESVATEVLPKIIEELEHAKKEITKLQAEKFKRQKGKSPRLLHTAVFNTNTILADYDRSIGLVELRKIPESEMTPWQKAFSKAYYCTRNYSRLKHKVDTELMPALRSALIEVFGAPVSDNVISMVSPRRS